MRPPPYTDFGIYYKQAPFAHFKPLSVHKRRQRFFFIKTKQWCAIERCRRPNISAGNELIAGLLAMAPDLAIGSRVIAAQ